MTSVKLGNVNIQQKAFALVNNVIYSKNEVTNIEFIIL